MFPRPPRPTLFPTRRSSDLTHWGGTAIATAVILAAANIADNALTAANFASGAFNAVWERATSALTTARSEEHTSELQSLRHLVCRLLLEKKKNHEHTTKNTS